jgi:hypothetical protein
MQRQIRPILLRQRYLLAGKILLHIKNIISFSGEKWVVLGS